jgi:hypothetical protein
MKKSLGVLMLGAAIGGCGSSLDNSNGPAAAVAACMQLREASVQRSARCAGGTAADWRAYDEGYLGCAAYDRHVRDGLVEYFPGMLAACLAQYALPCHQQVNCFWEVLHGLVPDGQYCRDSGVCGPVSACLNPGPDTCGEVCMRFGKEHETCGIYCGDTTPCLEFAACGYDLACVNDVCVKAKSVGASCGGGDPVPCNYPSFCTAELADQIGTCKVPVSAGACRSDYECPGTEFCFEGACTARRALGSYCVDAPIGCAAWTKCDSASGTCVAAAKPGLPCGSFPGTSGADSSFCGPGTCNADGICVAIADAGGSCAGASCAPGTSCDMASLLCVACDP